MYYQSCLFCNEEATRNVKVPNRDAVVGLCGEHYISKTPGEILEMWRKKFEGQNEDNSV